jgi:hypothetical protein
MKFIWRCTASGNEAIMQNKSGSSGNRDSTLHLTTLFPPLHLPLLFPHPIKINCPFRSFEAPHTSSSSFQVPDPSLSLWICGKNGAVEN